MSRTIFAKFLLALFLLAPLLHAPLLFAAELVNINTADKTTLKTLDGVGDAIAQQIIDGRPYASIEEVSKVDGIGNPGSISYEKIKNYITVGATGTTQEQTQSQTQTPAPVPEQPQGQTAPAGPPALTVRIMAPERVMSAAGSYFLAEAYGTQNLPLPGARFIWNFGDGAAAEGARVFHIYAYPGRYAVSVTAAYNYSAGVARATIEAAGSAVSLEAVGDGSLLVRNSAAQEADVGLWLLSDGGKTYLIPESTVILAGEGVRFAGSITGLQGSRNAALLYPNGTQAAAASVAQGSLLRGERVTKQKLLSVAPAPASPSVPAEPAVLGGGEVLGASDSVVPKKEGSPAFWGSFAALTGLLAAGGAAAHYVRSRTKTETSLTAEEFDIE